MKKILGLAVALCALPQLATADHQKLEVVAQHVVVSAGQLYNGARRVIGYYPTYHQRYAFEHIGFLYNSARRFQSVLHAARSEARDHDHDQLISQAHRKLEHDAYYARETFDDLFHMRDHTDYARLNQLLTDIEYSVEEMHHHLP